MPLRPGYQVYQEYLDNPAGMFLTVTPSDSSVNDLTVPISVSIYVGGTGNVAVVMAGGDGTPVVFTAVPAGTTLPVRAVRVAATLTTATLMLFGYGAS